MIIRYLDPWGNLRHPTVFMNKYLNQTGQGKAESFPKVPPRRTVQKGQILRWLDLRPQARSKERSVDPFFFDLGFVLPLFHPKHKTPAFTSSRVL